MKKLLVYTLFSLAFTCAPTETLISDYDETVNFNAYSTFVICIDDLFVEYTSQPKYDNNEVRNLISDAVESKMIALGHKTNVLNPELQAGFKLIVEQKESTFKNCELEDELNYWHECTINTEVYTTETLVVYVSDFEKNQIIWQASTDCNMNKSVSKIKPYINNLVTTLFKEYPRKK